MGQRLSFWILGLERVWYVLGDAATTTLNQVNFVLSRMTYQDKAKKAFISRQEDTYVRLHLIVWRSWNC